MIHAREDYNDRFQDAAGMVPENEPVFLIRAQDQVGHHAVRVWAHLHRLSGGSDVAYTMAMRHADLMEQWPIKKAADVPQAKAKA
jgi:hypothetical protein